MHNIKDLFFHLTPSTLAAIAVDLDGDWAMRRYWDAAVLAGYNGEVARILARQGR